MQRPIKHIRFGGYLVFSAFLASSGCASAYMTPDGGADLAIFTDSDIQEILDRKPVARFPAHLALVRVQAPRYRSYGNEGYGRGRFSIVSVRDMETEEDFDRIAKSPAVVEVAPLNRLLIGDELDSDRPLRHAAASLHSDVLMVYTVDTNFFVNDPLKPLTVISLGLSPNKLVTVSSSASAILMDVRTGYVFGACEATSRETKLASAWTDRDAVDRTRIQTERQSFAKLLDQFDELLLRLSKSSKSLDNSLTGRQSDIPKRLIPARKP